MKPLPLLCFAGALVLACVLATSYTMPETPDPSNVANTPGRTPGPYDTLKAPATAGTSPTSAMTPAAALVMQECMNAVFADAARAGATKVAMHHFAQIDHCAALVRAGILAR